MLVLVAGDAHIPDRSSGIPEPILKLLVRGKIEQVVTVGNITDDATKQMLQKLTPGKKVITVLGSEDIPGPDTRTSVKFRVGKAKVGAVSSFHIIPQDDTDTLATKARQMDVDILLWGGSSHQETQEWAGSYFINPGSLTGAPTPAGLIDGTEFEAGFCLLDIADAQCTVFMYKLQGESVKVEKAVLKLHQKGVEGNNEGGMDASEENEKDKE